VASLGQTSELDEGAAGHLNYADDEEGHVHSNRKSYAAPPQTLSMTSKASVPSPRNPAGRD
jgi:hypothetical protein